MVFKNFAHILLTVFGLVVALVLLMIAAITGVLGDVIQSSAKEMWQRSADLYRSNSEVIDLGIKVVTFTGSGLAAAFAVFKGWYYAESNLPNRVLDFLERANTRLVGERRELIPSLDSVTSITELPLVAVRLSGLDRIMQFFGGNPRKRHLNSYEERAANLFAGMSVLEKRAESCRTQRSTALFIRALELVRQSNGPDQSDPEKGTNVQALLDEAIKLSNRDLDGLEIAAKQAFALRMDAKALQTADEMERAAILKGDTIRTGRALRFQAEVLAGRSNSASWDEARAKAKSAADTLNDGNRNNQLQLRELAKAIEVLVDVQILRDRLTSAGTELDRARALYRNSITDPWKTDGLERLRLLQAKLDQAKDDGFEKDN